METKPRGHISPFTIEYKDKNAWIRGDFRYGTYFDEVIPDFSDWAQGDGFRSLDLTDLIFIDTDGMKAIRRIEDFVHIAWDMDSWSYKRYMEWRVGK